MNDEPPDLQEIIVVIVGWIFVAMVVLFLTKDLTLNF